MRQYRRRGEAATVTDVPFFVESAHAAPHPECVCAIWTVCVPFGQPVHRPQIRWEHPCLQRTEWVYGSGERGVLFRLPLAVATLHGLRGTGTGGSGELED